MAVIASNTVFGRQSMCCGSIRDIGDIEILDCFGLFYDMFKSQSVFEDIYYDIMDEAIIKRHNYSLSLPFNLPI